MEFYDIIIYYEVRGYLRRAGFLAEARGIALGSGLL